MIWKVAFVFLPNYNYSWQTHKRMDLQIHWKRKTNLDEAFVEAQIVPDWVLPTLLVVLVVRELQRDVLVDACNILFKKKSLLKILIVLVDAQQQTLLNFLMVLQMPSSKSVQNCVFLQNCVCKRFDIVMWNDIDKVLINVWIQIILKLCL